MKHNQKIALITGAGKRIGRHLALSLANGGWDIAAHFHRSEKDIESLKNEVEALGRQLLPLKADLSDAQQVEGLLPQCCENLGRPTLLINNASVFEKDSLGSITSQSFDTHMAVNFKAPLLLSQAFSESLQIRQEGTDQTGEGNIINITDQRVFSHGPSFVSYTASKIALSEATRTLAQALAPHIRVNAIAPGPVLQSIHQTAAEFEAEVKATPLGRGAALEEISETVDFILKTPSMTGVTITLDGGQRFKERPAI